VVIRERGGWTAIIAGAGLLLFGIVFGYALPRVDVPAPKAHQTGSVRVYPERRVGAEWQVPWEYEGIMSVSRHATAEEARRLYSVLAAAMVTR
jgi:hypothetical protein